MTPTDINNVPQDHGRGILLYVTEVLLFCAITFSIFVSLYAFAQHNPPGSPWQPAYQMRFSI